MRFVRALRRWWRTELLMLRATFRVWWQAHRTPSPPSTPPPVKVPLPAHLDRIFRHLSEMEAHARQAKLLLAALPELTLPATVQFPPVGKAWKSKVVMDPPPPWFNSAPSASSSTPSAATASATSDAPRPNDAAVAAAEPESALQALHAVQNLDLPPQQATAPWKHPMRVRTSRDVSYRPSLVQSTPLQPWTESVAEAGPEEESRGR